MARINNRGGVTLQNEMTYTERRERVARRYLEGKTQSEIAKEFEVNQSTISRDLEVIRELWVKNAVEDFNEVKVKELVRIDRLEREYWLAWDRSQEDAETMQQKGKPLEGEKMGIQEAVKTIKGQVGNPSFLAGVQWCIEQRLKIFGLYAPTRATIDHSWRDKVPEGVNPDEVFGADVEHLLALMTGENIPK